MENKQTAVEWLIEQVKSKEWQDKFIWHKEEAFEQAKAMMEEQIVEAHEQGCDDFLQERHYNAMYGKGYYNETYNQKNNG